MEFKGWLQEQMDARQMTPSELARLSKVPQPTIFRILSGETKDPRTNTVKRIERVLGVESPPLVVETLPKEDEIHLERFDTGGAMGHGVLLRDQPGVIQSWNVSREWLNKNVRAHSGAQNLCIVTGFGDSMRPMFNPGDPLIVDRGVKLVEFDAIYFFRVGSEGFIKRLQRIPGEGLRVISTNKEYESWTVRPDMDFEVFGRVLKVWCSEDF